MVDFFEEGFAELCCDFFCEYFSAVVGVGGDVAECGDFVFGRAGMDAGDAYQLAVFSYAEVAVGLEHFGVEPVVGIALLVEFQDFFEVSFGELDYL